MPSILRGTLLIVLIVLLFWHLSFAGCKMVPGVQVKYSKQVQEDMPDMAGVGDAFGEEKILSISDSNQSK